MKIDKDKEQQKEEIYKEINKYKFEIQKILNEIEKCSIIGNKIELYQKILKLDNTQEKYVLDYLLCYQQTLRVDNQNDEENFQNELKKYQICISDENYNANFKKYYRKNAREKILYFINLVKDSSINDEKGKIKIISSITFLLWEINKCDFCNKKKITWNNEELYLNHIYKTLIYSVCYLIIYYNKVELKELNFDDQEFIKIKTNLSNAKNVIEKNFWRNSLTNYLLLQSNYFKYLLSMKKFLLDVEKEFQQRFGNLELVHDKDKSLFEDYINFLGTFKFKTRDYNNFWKEVFVPLDLENKKKLIASTKNDSYELDFELNEKGNLLTISFLTDKYSIDKEKNKIDTEKYTIDTEKYSLKNFITIDALLMTNIDQIKWILNKYLKPNFYEKELFVCITKETWKSLIVNILQSQAYIEVRNSLFTETQINFFLIDDIMKDIIDNIKFFIYDTTFLGVTNSSTNYIYEYGNVNLEIENESVALLIFYAFHIIINIHEIGGHLNIKFQYFISLKETFQSPEIKPYLKDKYTNSGKERNKESGETMEIELFGEVKEALTIKEAIFILDKDNYSISSTEFKNNFLNCNNKTLKELLNDNMISFLKKLGIDSTKLDEKDKTIYKYPLKRKYINSNKYTENKTRHPMSFYYNFPKLIKEYFEEYPIMNDNREELKK